ncbi:hypothetical protein XI00_36000 [Bradyrhizobium sp. CCBAU 21359]|nr:hypothetical protein [Bradyrhizobium sp. CCBAU 21359]
MWVKTEAGWDVLTIYRGFLLCWRSIFNTPWRLLKASGVSCVMRSIHLMFAVDLSVIPRCNLSFAETLKMWNS